MVKEKKPVLSSSAAHKSSAIKLTQTSISSQLDNKYITTNQNKNNTSNTYDIHSCVTPRKQNYSIQVTSKTTCLIPLKTHFLLHLLSYTEQKSYPRLVNIICVFMLTESISCFPVCQTTDTE